MKILLPVLSAVFLAEPGDKTQFACVLFASDSEADKFSFFIGAAPALTVARATDVYAGCPVSRKFNCIQLRITAGTGLIVTGIWTLLRQ